jgi:hypothetical protein
LVSSISFGTLILNSVLTFLSTGSATLPSEDDDFLVVFIPPLLLLESDSDSCLLFVSSLDL